MLDSCIRTASWSENRIHFSGKRSAHRREHAGIDAVGFRQKTGGASEVAGAAWIDAGETAARRRQRGAQGAVATASGFEDDEIAFASERGRKGRDLGLGIGDALVNAGSGYAPGEGRLAGSWGLGMIASA